MAQVAEKLLDRNGVEITVKSIVRIHETSFDGCDGLVMDIASDLEPEDGPVAVFFDREVSSYKFNPIWVGLEKFSTPTPENYKNNSRVICFDPQDLEVREEWSIENLCDRFFPDYYHSISTLTFPLQKDKWPCAIEGCMSDKKATEKTLLNFWGTVYEIYTCIECH